MCEAVGRGIHVYMCTSTSTSRVYMSTSDQTHLVSSGRGSHHPSWRGRRSLCLRTCVRVFVRARPPPFPFACVSSPTDASLCHTLQVVWTPHYASDFPIKCARSLSRSCSLSFPYASTHTHTRARTHTNIQEPASAHTHTHTPTQRWWEGTLDP